MEYIVIINFKHGNGCAYKTKADNQRFAITKALQIIEEDFYGYFYHNPIVNINVIECSGFKEI